MTINTFLTKKGESLILKRTSTARINDKTISETEAEVKKENIQDIIEITTSNRKQNKEVAAILHAIICNIEKLSETFSIQNLEKTFSETLVGVLAINN